MLNRFYMTMALWFSAVCALGLFAHNSQSGIAIVLLGIIPIGLAFILLLLFFVLPRPSQTPAQAWTAVLDQDLAVSAPVQPVVDWRGQANSFSIEPQHQCNTIRLPTGRPALRLVRRTGADETI